jgi:glycosyltransferase involved in cell wall biosynthesis
VRIGWLVYGDLGQPTGGYIYDRIVVEGLRAAGDDVVVVDPRFVAPRDAAFDVLVGDALCVRELGSWFEEIAATASRAILVHHLPSWELDRDDTSSQRAFERRAIGAADRCVATGHATARRLSADYPGLPVDVVLPGSDRLPPAVREGASRSGPVTFLFVGSITPRKRVLSLLDAFEPIAAPRTKLVLLGDPSRDPDYARAVAVRVEASPALRASVEQAGVASDEALARAMAHADVLVLPSSLEGYGMALAEALHAGLPVVASREAALAAGVVAHDAVAVLGDAAGWSHTLAELARDSAVRLAMARAARAGPMPRWVDAVAAFRACLTPAPPWPGGRTQGSGPSR